MNESNDEQVKDEIVEDLRTPEATEESLTAGVPGTGTPIEATEELVDEPRVAVEETLETLQAERMGTFKVKMMYADAAYFRNLLDKSTFKGPQQAYLLIIAKAEMSGVVESLKKEDKKANFDVDLTSATIESLGYFINKSEGKGADSATRLFTASMMLRPVMGQINEIDEKLKSIKEDAEAE